MRSKVESPIVLKIVVVTNRNLGIKSKIPSMISSILVFF